MISRSYLEGYITQSALDDIVLDHLLIPANGPENVTLHVVDDALAATSLSRAARVSSGQRIPLLITVADLADGGAREQQQAELLLKGLLSDD